MWSILRRVWRCHCYAHATRNATNSNNSMWPCVASASYSDDLFFGFRVNATHRRVYILIEGERRGHILFYVLLSQEFRFGCCRLINFNAFSTQGCRSLVPMMFPRFNRHQSRWLAQTNFGPCAPPLAIQNGKTLK